MTIGRASWWGTGLFAASAVAAAAWSEPPLEAAALAVAILLFVLGCMAFTAAYAKAVSRSRQELIGVAQVFLLTGDVAPPPVRRSLLGALGVQVAVALGTAIARPYSSLAAGTLVPMFGLGLCGLWASRYGSFPPRPQPERPGGRRPPRR